MFVLEVAPYLIATLFYFVDFFSFLTNRTKLIQTKLVANIAPVRVPYRFRLSHKIDTRSLDRILR
jgi:hypothetical protein